MAFSFRFAREQTACRMRGTRENTAATISVCDGFPFAGLRARPVAAQRIRQDQVRAFPATIIVGALMLPDVMFGNTDASTIRSACSPCTRNDASTTDVAASGPIAHEPHR